MIYSLGGRTYFQATVILSSLVCGYNDIVICVELTIERISTICLEETYLTARKNLTIEREVYKYGLNISIGSLIGESQSVVGTISS